MGERINDFLIDSLKQDQGYYSNNRKANHPYPCSICQNYVSPHQEGLCCTSCSLKVHIKCNGTTLDEYNQIQELNEGLTEEDIKTKKWKCNKCVILNMAKTFPFGLQSFL